MNKLRTGKVVVFAMLLSASVGTVLTDAAPAHAAIPASTGTTVGYTVSSYPESTSLSGTLTGGSPSISGGPSCEKITLTRYDNYYLFKTTIYQAHLEVCRQWNMLAYGGVVWNVSWRMWVDHLSPTINWGGNVLSNGHYQYSCVWYWGLGRTVCGDHLGFRVDAGTAVQQCLSICIQSESISAWMQVYDNGQWVGDLSHN